MGEERDEVAALRRRLRREKEARLQAESIAESATRELYDSNRRLEQFAQVISHDLQEPLRAISGCLQLLVRRHGERLGPSGQELVDHAVAGADRMKAMIQGLLEYSRVRIRQEPLQPVDCGDLLQGVLEGLQEALVETGATVTRGALPVVRADPALLARVLHNLVGNAVKFHSPERPSEIHVEARRDEREWVFTVRDNGIGIEPRFQQRIFQPFERLHPRSEYPGLGIGLALSREIVERYGGRLWVESIPGEGSTFAFTLPDPGPGAA